MCCQHTDWVALAWLAARRVPRSLEGEGVAEEAGLAGLAVEAGGVVDAPGKGKICFGAEIAGTSMLLHHKKNIYPAAGATTAATILQHQ